MRITNLQTNHFSQPLGWDFSYIHFSWECRDSNVQTDLYTRIQIFKNTLTPSTLVFDSQPLYSWHQPFYEPDFVPEPCTRYYWQVEIVLSDGQHIFSQPGLKLHEKRRTGQPNGLPPVLLTIPCHLFSVLSP